MNNREQFQQILMKAKIDKNISNMKPNQDMKQLLDFINCNLPKTLYKFRNLNKNTLQAFEMGEIWLSNANQFNDVHDTLTYVNKDLICKQISSICDKFINSYSNLIDYKLIIDKIGINDSEIKNACLDGTDKVKQLSSNDFNSNLVQSIIFPLINYGLDELQKLFRTEIKMACLSENINSPLMWAHYADFHKGFALGYEFDNNKISKCSNCIDLKCDERINANIFPIIYSDNRFDVTEYAKWYIEQSVRKMMSINSEDEYSDKLIHYKIALHKSLEWEYEKEWRIIGSTSNKVFTHSKCYPIRKKPISLYLGCQIPDEDKEILIKVARRQGLEIPIYQMYVEKYSDKYEINSKLI